MGRRRLVVVLVGLAVVAGGAVLLWPRPARITWDNYEAIRIGMARAQVEAILGPPGFYATGAVYPLLNLGRRKETDAEGDRWVGEMIGTLPTNAEADFWQGNGMIVYLYFDPAGVVAAKEYRETVRLQQGPIDRFLFLLTQIERQRRYSEHAKAVLNRKQRPNGDGTAWFPE
jgi:hypothetical protein